ncbi:MAG: GNAT family N-acetyltransferase [Pseudomonadota bacterium]
MARPEPCGTVKRTFVISTPDLPGLTIRQLSAISEIPADAWNRLAGVNPFVRHEYLAALENGGAVDAESGWSPCHLVAERGDQLEGAVPLYLKTHSYGEFVFDWAWADAAQRAGLPYYPKLLSGSPLTPVSGPRLLAEPGSQAHAALPAALREICQLQGLSSVHVNFVEPQDAKVLRKAGFLERCDWQYHWKNNDYADFDAFLAALTHKKRKNIRQERRKLANAGWTFERVTGDQAEDWHWRFINSLYRETFHRKGNWPLLTEDIFRQLGRDFGAQVLLVIGRLDGVHQAGAWLIHDHHTLYGRYWGCFSESPGLHFETCYYQGIEFCIEQELAVFNPGAQGLHKVARGFEPVQTLSFHELTHPGLRDAVERSLKVEKIHQDQRGAAIAEHSAFRQDQG